MNQAEAPIPLEPSDAVQPANIQRPRLNVVELAARRGIGPLSPLGNLIWHGKARPCVSCGQLVRRTDEVCTECGQSLSESMLEKMQAHSGPWYVREHVRPFPGVSLDRLIRQVRRGVLTRTTVVRGPTTYHQWRYAAETPALSKHLGCCWVCQSAAQPADAVCGACGVDLDGGFGPDGSPRAEPPGGESAEIAELSSAVRSVPATRRTHGEDGPVRVAGLPASWVVGVLFVLTMIAVFAAVWIRASAGSSDSSVPGDVTTAPASTAPAPEPAGAAEAGSKPRP